MKELILRINSWIKVNRPDYYAHLQPGVTEVQLNQFNQKFSLELPDHFRQLYRWRNGQDKDCSESLQDNFMFSSLEEVISSKDLLDEMIGSDFESPSWWRRSWVPFLDNGGGDHLCLDLGAEDGGKPGQIMTFYHDWDNRPIRYPSLESWMENLIVSMENGSYTIV